MKARFVQEGKYIDYTASSDIAAGDVVVIGGIVGVANGAIATGTTGAVAVYGVYEVEKDSNAITAGATVYWNSENGKASASSSGNTAMGKAVAAAGDSDTFVRVKLG